MFPRAAHIVVVERSAARSTAVDDASDEVEVTDAVDRGCKGSEEWLPSYKLLDTNLFAFWHTRMLFQI